MKDALKMLYVKYLAVTLSVLSFGINVAVKKYLSPIKISNRTLK